MCIWCFVKPDGSLPKTPKWRRAKDHRTAVKAMIKNGNYRIIMQGIHQEAQTSQGLFVDFGAHGCYGLIRDV